MRPVPTRRVPQILRAKGCKPVGTEGSHEKWETPGRRSDTIVAGAKELSPGLLRNIERVFAPEFGERWLQKELGR